MLGNFFMLIIFISCIGILMTVTSEYKHPRNSILEYEDGYDKFQYKRILKMLLFISLIVICTKILT